MRTNKIIFIISLFLMFSCDYYHSVRYKRNHNVKKYSYKLIAVDSFVHSSFDSLTMDLLNDSFPEYAIDYWRNDSIVVQKDSIKRIYTKSFMGLVDLKLGYRFYYYDYNGNILKIENYSDSGRRLRSRMEPRGKVLKITYMDFGVDF